MADSSTPPPATESNSQQSEPENPLPQPNQPDPSSPSSSSTPSSSVPVNPNPSPPPPIISPQPPSVQPYAAPQIPVVPPSAPPSFRPVAPPVPVPSAPQFSPLPNPNFPNSSYQNPSFQNSNLPNSSYQNPSVQPPGVSPVPVMVPGAVSVGGSVGASVPQMIHHYALPGQPPNPALRPYAPMQNGYQTMPAPAPHGTIPPPGIPRYPSPYTTMIRQPFPPRLPGAIGMLPILSRPPVPGIRPPIIPPVVRPSVAPSVTPAEKPQTTVYVGKIASTVENDFMLSLLQLCGPVKNWKRAQDPTNGSPKGFGFCEFDSAEGVLRALRLLSKLNVDGQELVLNVNQATREFLESYVEKKKENSKKLKTETEGINKEEENAPGVEKRESPKPSVEDTKKDHNDSGNKETHDVANFGMVTDEDREADREALEKLTGMLEDRLKTRPLPPPPPQMPVDGSGNSNSEQPAKSKDWDSDVDIVKNDAAEDKNDNEMTSERRTTGDHDRPETSSPDRSRRHDRRSRDKDRDLKREKERELERYEREREQERATRERQRELKIREDEHRYNVLVKDWESREREKERKRKLDKEREKEREYKRRREISDQEPDSDDDDTKRRKHRSNSSDERRRRLREKEEDLVDRLKENEEIAEAKMRADEEQKQHRQQEQDALKLSSVHVTIGSDEIVLPDGTDVGSNDKAVERTSDGDCGHGDHIGDVILQNGTSDESMMEAITSDTRQSSNAPARKLGFGLVGSGKRTAVPSVFHEEEDEDARKEKKMRPLVPIDYSTEELQAGQPTVSGAPSSNLVAAAEFAKRISNATPKEERHDMERERSRRSHDRSGQRDRDRNEESNRTRNETRKETLDRDRDREHGLDRTKTPDNQKLLDAKQLIDMIPKTKEELFSYDINWAIYDKNELHDRMRPWISKKITEFLGEEEATLVDYIVSSTREHVKASDMLGRLQIILDDEAEMFVLKMWRMLIFEIKKIETGLALRSKA